MNKREIAHVFDERRKELKLTKIQIAEISGIDSTTITRIVRNPDYKGCQFDTMGRLLEAVGLELVVRVKEEV